MILELSDMDNSVSKALYEICAYTHLLNKFWDTKHDTIRIIWTDLKQCANPYSTCTVSKARQSMQSST